VEEVQWHSGLQCGATRGRSSEGLAEVRRPLNQHLELP
jgi:hypothetical protein